MTPAKFIVTAGPIGLEQCVINGKDVLGMIAGLQINITDGQPTEIFLRQAPGATGTLEGEGIVYLPGGDLGASVAQWLGTINSQELEDEIMNSMEWGDGGSMVQATINALLERANGGS